MPVLLSVIHPPSAITAVGAEPLPAIEAVAVQIQEMPVIEKPAIPEPKRLPPVQELIVEMATMYNVNSSTMLEIARCESRFRADARNPHSTAKGVFQILDGTWTNFKCEGSVLNAEDNIRCAMKIASTSGIHHWNASLSCWAS